MTCILDFKLRFKLITINRFIQIGAVVFERKIINSKIVENDKKFKLNIIIIYKKIDITFKCVESCYKSQCTY